MRERGVSLIELIIVIVVLVAGVALLGSAFVEPARSVADNENIQTTWHVAQACADHALGRRRPSGASGGFANITVGMANPCPTLGGVTPTFTVTDTSGAGACAGLAGTCRQIAITAAKGGYTASVNLVVVDY